MSNRSSGRKSNTRGQETREIILSSAMDIFSRLGFEAATTRMIARAAGRNISTVLYHFKDKRDLYDKVFKQKFDSEFSAMKAWHESVSDPLPVDLEALHQALEEGGMILMQRLIDDPALFRLNVYRKLQPSNADAAIDKAYFEQTRLLAEDVLEKARKAGILTCSQEEIVHFTKGFSWLGTGFALAHLPKISGSREHKEETLKLFQQLIRTYIRKFWV
ncbi:MAG: TetR family transcriptional regulator [Anaerolineales bacterium]